LEADSFAKYRNTWPLPPQWLRLSAATESLDDRWQQHDVPVCLGSHVVMGGWDETSRSVARDPSRSNLDVGLFRQNCAACHSQERGQNLVGPSLFSVVGRAAASTTDFSYSAAMKRSEIVWTSDQLMAYLKAPRKYVPGAKMMFPGLADDKDRENIVAFLATLGEATSASPIAVDSQTPKVQRGSN
jgi:cytochrome c